MIYTEIKIFAYDIYEDMTQGGRGGVKHPRNIGLDILRVLCMFMIVAFHYLFHCYSKFAERPFLIEDGFDLFNFATVYGVNLILTLAVNCYVMITGFFLIDKPLFRVRALVKLWRQVLFYSVLLSVFSYFLLSPSIKDIILSFFPIATKRYWFVTTYFGLMLIAPFISSMVNSLNKNRYIFLLFVAFILDFKYPYGLYFSEYNSLVHFVFLFLIGGFFKKFGLPKLISRHAGKMFLGLWIGCTFVMTIVSLYKGQGTLQNTGYNGLLLPMSVLFFSFFLQKKWAKISDKMQKLIQVISPLTFGVYLFHDHPLFKVFLWSHMSELGFSGLLLLRCFMVASFVFILGLAVDYSRYKIFDFLNIA